MASKSKAVKYFLRVVIGGLPYFLLRTTYDKANRCMQPVWWPEHTRGVSCPMLFKSIASARAAQTRYVPPPLVSTIKEWSEPDGQSQAEST